jgi:predicted transcriptional regulator
LLKEVRVEELDHILNREDSKMATLIELAASLVESHASTTAMTTEELLKEIELVYNALKNLEAGVVAPVVTEANVPTITAKQSIKPNEVICLICGKGGMQTLARHLNTAHNMKPGEYRKQFGISSKQPLVAKKFSESRRKTALEKDLAGNLAKAREVRMANIAAAKVAGAKKAPQSKKAVKKD